MIDINDAKKVDEKKLNSGLQKIKSKNKLNYIVNVDIDGKHTVYYKNGYDSEDCEIIDSRIEYSQIKLIADAISSKDCSDNVHINLQHNSIDGFCDFYYLSSFPKNMERYKNSYIYYTYHRGDYRGDMMYIDFDKTVENFKTNITDKTLRYSRIYPYINIDDGVRLTKTNFEKLITLNGGPTFDDKQAKLLANACKAGKRGLSLDLSNNEISDVGATAFADGIQSGKYPIYFSLNLDNNNITTEGLSALLIAAKSPNRPYGLNINCNQSHNSNIGNQISRQIKVNNFIDDHAVSCFTFLLHTKDFLPMDIVRHMLLLEIINISIDNLMDTENQTPKIFAKAISEQTAGRYAYCMKNIGFFNIKPKATIDIETVATIDIETVQQRCKNTLSFGIQQLLEQNDKSFSVELKHGEMTIVFDSNSDANIFLKTLNKDTYLFQKEVKLDNRREIDHIIKNICKLDPDEVYQIFPEFLSPTPKNSWFF